MELIMEILFEVYLELMMFIVPEEKTTSKKYRYFCLFVALVVLVAVLALFLWGISLLVDQSNPLGWIPITVATLISLAQIITGIHLYCKKEKK